MKHGVCVELRTELISFAEGDGGVVANVLKQDAAGQRREEIAASYIVSAEGGRSMESLVLL